MTNKYSEAFQDIQPYSNTGYLISNFTQYNIKYIDEFVIKIRNPKPNSILYKNVYEVNLWFEKNNIRLIKYFYNNDINDLLEDVSKFISNEIKI